VRVCLFEKSKWKYKVNIRKLVCAGTWCGEWLHGKRVFFFLQEWKKLVKPEEWHMRRPCWLLELNFISRWHWLHHPSYL
jgi:hypothetical protein